MDQSDHVISVTASRVYKAIRKLSIKTDFWYQRDIFVFFFHVCLVPEKNSLCKWIIFLVFEQKTDFCGFFLGQTK